MIFVYARCSRRNYGSRRPEMNLYTVLGSFVAFLVFVPLTYRVWRKTLQQNVTTYALWGMLDFVAAGSIFLKDGNYLLPAMYSLLSFGVVLGGIRAKTFSFGKLEAFISALVLICMGVWYFVGDREATIISSISVSIASIPLIVDSLRKPMQAPVLEYIGFTIANGLSIAGGADWSVAERFYPGVCTATTAIFVIVLLACRFRRTRLT